jgi:hypothetical protein
MAETKAGRRAFLKNCNLSLFCGSIIENLVKSRFASFYSAGEVYLSPAFEVNSNGFTNTLPLCGIDGLFTSPSCLTTGF